ncbi:MAG: WD40 repeat domain-containing protein, partial [Pirellulaceae bacterium]
PVLRPPENFTLAAVALNQDGTRVVAAGIGGSMYWWETAKGGEGTPLVVRTESTESIQGLSFSPDGNRVATGSQEGGVAVWELATNETMVTWNVAGPASCVAFSPDGRWLAAGTGKMSFGWPQDSPIHVWDLTTGRGLEARVGHEDVVTDVAFSPDSQRKASSSRDGSVRVWDIPPLPAWRAEQELPVTGSLLAWNSSALLAGYLSDRPGGEVQLVDIPSGRVATLRGSPTYATAVGLAADGLSAAVADGEGTVTILDVAAGKTRWTHKSRGRFQSLQFSPDSQMVCEFGSDGPRDSWHVWEVATGREDTERKAPPGRVFAAWCGAAGRIVLAVQSRTELATETFLWDLQVGGKLCDLPDASGEGGPFSADGTRLTVIGVDLADIRIYDTATGKLIHTVSGHRGQIRSLDFSPDGHTLVSASEVSAERVKTPGDVIVWDVATSRQRMAWPGAPPVAFSSDGRRLAWKRDPTGSIVVWRAANPDEIARTTVLPR